MSTCRSCHAEIVWATTAATGKAMPVDVDPVPDGNVVLDQGPRGLMATVVAAGQASLDERPLHTSHFATCPNATQHRRPR